MQDTDSDSGQAGWRDLLSGRHLPAVVVLAGGVALYATNVYLATSLLPSAVSEIGGQRLYAWNTTVFLLASVASSVLVSRLLRASGGRGAYLVALGLFAAGSVICAVAPAMAVLLIGRAIQGAGGGLLAGLAYSLIRSALPSRLWARGIAVTSAMWGVGTLIGPVVGGALAQFTSWRGAFVLLTVATLVLAIIVPRALGRDRSDATPEPLPVVSLILVVAAALAVSVASLVGTALVSVLGVAAGVLLIAGFLWHERRTGGTGVFPRAMFAATSRLRWIYATLALLAIGSQVEGFVPLFGQRLAGLAPLAAAFLGAALAVGWILAQIPSAGVTAPGRASGLILSGPILLTVGVLATAFIVRPSTGGWALAAWVVALVIAGAGIGAAWPLLSAGVLGAVTDPAEGNKAAAAINTVQLLANSIGAALTGLLVNLGDDTLASARYLSIGIAVITTTGVLAALAAAPSRDRQAAPN